jgi:hypothetical protein
MSDVEKIVRHEGIGSCPNCYSAETDILVSTDGPVIRFSIRWCRYCGSITQYTSSNLGGHTSTKFPEMTSKYRCPAQYPKAQYPKRKKKIEKEKKDG